MEKMTKIEALCETVAMELVEIKMHICNGRLFEGGVGLGGLISSVVDRQFKEQEARKKNEEVQDEECDEECEEGSEEEDYQTLYYAKCEEFIEKREELIDYREENKKLNNLNTRCFDLMKELYNNDQVHPNQREDVRQLLLQTDEFQDTLNGRLTRKQCLPY